MLLFLLCCFCCCGFRTPLNMTLYRSILMLGISTSSSEGALELANELGVTLRERSFQELAGGIGDDGGGGCSHCLGSTGAVVVIGRSVFDLTSIGTCLGPFLPLIVLLLDGTALPAGSRPPPVVDRETAELFAEIRSAAFAESDCFPLPNKAPNILCLVVFRL